jgi:hypothetical protein
MMVMTIVTGVSSPWIIGKDAATVKNAPQRSVNEELGIELLN